MISRRERQPLRQATCMKTWRGRWSVSWKRVRGHEAQAEAFDRAVHRGRLAHAYLFVGPPGVGKRLFAVELAKALLCESRRDDDRLEGCDHCPACAQVEARHASRLLHRLASAGNGGISHLLNARIVSAFLLEGGARTRQGGDHRRRRRSQCGVGQLFPQDVGGASARLGADSHWQQHRPPTPNHHVALPSRSLPAVAAGDGWGSAASQRRGRSDIARAARFSWRAAVPARRSPWRTLLCGSSGGRY